MYLSKSYSLEELRQIICGEISFRKCPACDKNGLEYWDENGNGVSSFPHPDWGDNYQCGPCESCDGLGYIENPKK